MQEQTISSHYSGRQKKKRRKKKKNEKRINRTLRNTTVSHKLRHKSGQYLDSSWHGLCGQPAPLESAHSQEDLKEVKVSHELEEGHNLG